MKPFRVAPTGALVQTDLRCEWLGNRGCLHGAPGELARRWQVKRWITCVTEFKERRHPLWGPGRYTPLFLYDEAVALAAGHRPCAECRRPAYNAFLDAWESAHGSRPRADPMDEVLHRDRREGDEQRTHRRAWTSLPVGAFVLTGASEPAVVLADSIVPWSSAAGYGSLLARPIHGSATVLTPAVTVDVILAGNTPQIGVA